MLQPASDQVSSSLVLILQEIQVISFLRGFGHVHKRYMTVKVDEGDLWTSQKLRLNGDVLSWKGHVVLNQGEASLTSIFELKIFQAPIMGGGNGVEISSFTHSIQSLLEAAEGRNWTLDSKNPKESLKATIIVFKHGSSVPQRDFINARREDLPEVSVALTQVITDANAAVSGIPQHKVSQLDKTMDSIHSATEYADTLDDTWEPLLDTLNRFMTVMDGIAEVHPYAKVAWSVLSAAYRVYKHQKDRDDAVLELPRRMKQAYDTILAGAALNGLRTEMAQVAEVRQAVDRHADVLQLLSIQTVQCGHFITKYAKDRSSFLGAGKQVLRNPQTIINGFITTFEQLQHAFAQQAAVSTELISVRMYQSVHRIETTVSLSGLARVYVVGAGCNSEKQCLAGTRTATLDEISDWINCTDDDTPQVCLLLGQAGTGKSTIAHTVACRFRRMKQLGGAFFFDSSRSQQSERVFATLAMDLAAFDPAFREALHQSVGNNFGTQTASGLADQFENFFIKPARHVAIMGTIFILLDGLDEIADVSARKLLLRTLSNGLRQLPSGFRILLTARPEPDILALFATAESGVDVRYIETIQNDPTLRGDIRSFIRAELTKPEHCVYDLDEVHYENLTDRSEGVFEWARVACKYIIANDEGGESPRERYEDLVESREETGGQANVLDELYQLVLSRRITLYNERGRRRFKCVMGLVLYAVEPLTMEAVQGLARHVPGLVVDVKDRRDDVHIVLSKLGSFLSGVSDLKTPVRPLHSSFRDFLTSESRSRKIMELTMALDPKTNVDCFIDGAPIHHANLAAACLRVLNSELRFNICKLNTSYQLNRDVPDLHERVARYISPELSYASRFWAQHIEKQSDSITKFVNAVKELLETNFLFWVETLSLLGELNSAGWALMIVIPLIRLCDDTLADLATDALRFVQNQARCISDSAPHIYLSALVTTPSTSLVRNHYGRRYSKTAELCNGGGYAWPWTHVISRGHSEPVCSVVFSLDGKRIVSGSGDNTIRIWDAQTGTPVGFPLEGHTEWVRAVALSPDGKRIVSGSDDNTILIWDVGTSKPIGGPLEGHSDWVRSVTFSRDGKWIVSGSEDKTIRIWDAQTGESVGGPLKGHDASVASVAISPDGMWIVSGSEDKTLRIWDATTGVPRGFPLDGHAHVVSSVAISPDGNLIVSGSEDRTLRIWDAKTGNLIGAPLVGHSSAVWSVAFSPDGTQIVSGSEDKTIRMWDSRTGKAIGSSLGGHGDWVRSVAFSPDGRRIVSGSDDHTLGIWEVEAAKAVNVPLEGHDNRVLAVAMAPDGKWFASGSDDRTIRVWDAATGTPVQAPFEGHTGAVWSVAVSPDGKQIVSGSEDNTVRIWDSETGTPLLSPLEGHCGTIWSVVYSSDGTRVVSSSEDKSIRIWDALTGALIHAPLEGHDDAVWSIAISPNGKCIASGSKDRSIRIWDADSGVLVGSPLEGHTEWVRSVAWSPDGDRIVSGSADNTLLMWDAATGVPIGCPLEGHTDWIRCVAVSPDGKQIVSGSDDRTVRVWDAETGIAIGAPLEGHSNAVGSVAISPDGQRIVSGSKDGTIRIWDVPTSSPETGPDFQWQEEPCTPPESSHDSPSGLPNSTQTSPQLSLRESGLAVIAFCHDVVHHPTQPYLDTQSDFVRVSLHYDEMWYRHTGWIMCNEIDHLLWLPPEQLTYLCTPRCRLVIPVSRMVTLDMSRFVHGERWAECYTSSP